MIVVKLIGGLGNQMFQYAAGKALAEKHGVALKVDLSHLKQDAAGLYTQRHYGLSVFSTDVKEAGSEETQRFSKANTKWSRLLQRRLPFLFKRVYAAESGSRYHPEFENYPPDTYLDGFWQSEKYFRAHAAAIRTAFQFKPEVVAAAGAWTNKVQSCNSVSLHIRRGDYIANAQANQFHGICSPEYYKKAVNYIQEHSGDPELFIFSDDLDWCRQNLQFTAPLHFVDIAHAGAELFLMSQCRHNVIANSSFSWWGAWLNTNPGKIVILPEFWFSGKRSSELDIAAENWIIV